MLFSSKSNVQISSEIYIQFIVCVLSVLLYTVNKLFFHHVEFCYCHLNDILCGTLLYPASISVAYVCGIKQLPSLIYGRFGVMALTFIASLYWEFVTPLFSKSSVSDLQDILCYIVGATIYLLIRRSFRLFKSRFHAKHVNTKSASKS